VTLTLNVGIYELNGAELCLFGAQRWMQGSDLQIWFFFFLLWWTISLV